MVEAADLRLGTLALGDVPGRGEHAGHLAALVAIDGGAVEHVGDRAGGVANGERVVADGSLIKRLPIAGVRVVWLRE